MKTSPLTSNLHKSKLVLHFTSNPLILYPLLALLVLLSSKPFFFPLALSLSTSLKNLWSLKEFIWSLMHLEEWVWRTASEECVWRNESEEELLKTRHQKQEHQKHWSSEAYLARSYFTRVDKGHCTKCTATNSATTFSAIFVSTTRQR